MGKTSDESASGAGVLAEAVAPDALFGRVASILDQARGNVVRAVNHNMVVAYWLIGREIVMELQRGQERAGYGDDLIAGLSRRLTQRYGAGWSKTNLWSYRLFFSHYQDRGSQIPHSLSVNSGSVSNATADCLAFHEHSTGSELSFRLSWTHYRTLIRIESGQAREFYEREAVVGNWTVRELERQIHTHSYERLLATQMRSRAKSETNALAANAAPVPLDSPAPPNPLETLKDPYILEFLDIPDAAALHESGLEGAIIAHLRDFLLELGKGFAFVARQKRLSFDGDDFYVDLVFYNWKLRCFLLIDLKMGRISHADVGQMDGYVRMFDDLMAGPEQNPTIGLILCTEHNNAVAKYSVLNDRRQIFASRYMTCLPTETELAAEIQRTRALLENRKSGE